MDREKEIQGIAQATCNFLDTNCEKCPIKELCIWQDGARRIYEAGYRKADEVRKETVIEILDYVGDFLILDTNGARKPLKELPAYLNVYSKYGVEVDK